MRGDQSRKKQDEAFDEPLDGSSRRVGRPITSGACVCTQTARCNARRSLHNSLQRHTPWDRDQTNRRALLVSGALCELPDRWNVHHLCRARFDGICALPA